MKTTDVLQNADTKRAYARSLFAVVAPKYGIATRALSFFRDIAWKNHLLGMLPPLAPTPVVLDIACGTGDITLRLRQAYPGALIIGCDLAAQMVHIAAKRMGPIKTAMLSLQDMGHPAIKDGSIDLVTGGYALRNAPDPTATLREIARILKADGAAAFLDFSKSDVPYIAGLQCAVLILWGGLWGLILHGRPSVYAYIGRSLAIYPDKKRLNRLFEETGLVVRSTRSRMFGLIRIDVVQKKEASGFYTDAGANVRRGGKKRNDASAFPGLHVPDFSLRSAKPERMDDPLSSEVRLHATLRHFSIVNRFFSRTRAQFRRFIFPDILAGGLRRVTILDVGAGGGDFARWCVSFLKRHDIAAKIICVDYDSRVIEYLRDSCADIPEIEIVHASLFQMDAVYGSIDYVVSIHVLHHFEDARIPEALALLYAKARRGILIIDLNRNLPAYFAYFIFSACFFHGGFSRSDGLVSIRKGFTEENLRGYIDTAGLNGLVEARRSAVWHFVLFGIKPKKS